MAVYCLHEHRISEKLNVYADSGGITLFAEKKPTFEKKKKKKED